MPTLSELQNHPSLTPTNSDQPTSHAHDPSTPYYDNSIISSAYVAGILFDMDGTIIDSGSAIERYWINFAMEHNLNPEDLLRDSHGRRSMDLLQLHYPELANWNYILESERKLPYTFGIDVDVTPGAREFVGEVVSQDIPWAIVTSATSGLLLSWIDKLSLPRPSCIITAEDAKEGKPNPECYLLAEVNLRKKSLAYAKRTGKLNYGRYPFLALEDAPCGIKAAKDAGCVVIGLSTTHHPQALKEAGADWVVKDMRSLKLQRWIADEGAAVITCSRVWNG